MNQIAKARIANATTPPATPPAIAAVFVEAAIGEDESSVEEVDAVVCAVVADNEVDNDAESDVVVLIDDVDGAVGEDIVSEEEATKWQWAVICPCGKTTSSGAQPTKPFELTSNPFAS
ncbi:hypothetical protein CNMCM6936_002187 [Aspergillus lentulus]|uniref:Uncharacterized protein n=1 Tax=Aspergillus lentulus TaxID=293939 RepID=A0AAN5YU24_ASPLE|nr:hypothetical protein CNMCM6936_002187 [Aspergillus lentulus]KAF4207472.1 hypothetical protein CNMCM8927_002877 [Aspergillus lentulus]